MVSTLWKACSEGNLPEVKSLLLEANEIDIEIKDHTGSTPLIEAVKNGHVEIVKLLLDKGADPRNRSSQGPPEHYTTDEAILDLLRSAAEARDMAAANYPQQNGQTLPNGTDSQNYYPPTEVYTYFPTLNSVPPPLPEGAVYYQPPAPGHEGANGDVRNLPPADIARFIPCRYFPACRYGASCMFLHPQGQYFQGPMPPPAQYPAPYDPMAPAPYPLNYYGPQSPNGVPQMAPMSPSAAPMHPMMHARSGSEVLSPAQTHFSPQGAPPPLPYGPMPPAAYHTNTAPVPMAIPPPPVHAPQGLQSPPVIYNGPPSAQPFPVHPEGASQYPPLPSIVPVPGPDVNGAAKPAAPEPYMQPYRDGSGNPRRGNGRRSSFASRKPPCFFFPAGRCKNGDDCRFPHILEPQNQHLPAQNAGRGGHRGPRGHISGPSLEQKFGAMSVRDVSVCFLTPDKKSYDLIQDGAQPRGPNGIERSISADSGRPRFQGLKTNQSIANTKKGPRQLQRVPNADEFPVLAGSVTPPSRSPGANGTLHINGFNGPTAAQVLQAPAPVRQNSTRESSTRGTSPDSAKAAKIQESTEIHINGTNGVNGVNGAANHDPSPVSTKLPISFAAVANAASDVSSKEISVSA
ncbi:hypothetical protein PC9H_003427 [Pleurotus ostreatus]|uniref:C3H1-type domain-containing protein n=1 Tax=Pleurotus ostreatus TaxID=5322 RepID=A0A8H7DTW4_PLEOS|nr:uncharacterized protein PC9H_003427 [Pleurotus ostreatus]KAF7436594.1 hypothetical protein PC9H_003427 [Pleurotus ostreatus]